MPQFMSGRQPETSSIEQCVIIKNGDENLFVAKRTYANTFRQPTKGEERQSLLIDCVTFLAGWRSGCISLEKKISTVHTGLKARP